MRTVRDRKRRSQRWRMRWHEEQVKVNQKQPLAQHKNKKNIQSINVWVTVDLLFNINGTGIWQKNVYGSVCVCEYIYVRTDTKNRPSERSNQISKKGHLLFSHWPSPIYGFYTLGYSSPSSSALSFTHSFCRISVVIKPTTSHTAVYSIFNMLLHIFYTSTTLTLKICIHASVRARLMC